MTHSKVFALLLGVALAAPAYAGKTGAGPAGSGATVGGSVIMTTSATNALQNTPADFVPGVAGTVQLTQEHARQLAAKLRKSDGAVVTGDIISAEITLANDAQGTVILDTETNTLTIAETKMKEMGKAKGKGSGAAKGQ